MEIKVEIITWAKVKKKIPYGVEDLIKNWWSIIWDKTIRTKPQPKWKAPPAGWLKLNFDGSSIGNAGMAGIGGLIRDDKAAIIMSFSGLVGICDANEAEVRVLLFGLQWAYENNQRPLIVEGDSTNVVAWASGHSNGPWKLQDLLAEILDLIRVLDPKIEHRRQSANEAADILAKAGVLRDEMMIVSSL
ncbi:uncharacterized protein LOC143892159 [Tasmannia lanceolata]|uniref:uncharacterized protein LOC143892159 n=1 Tax=Tasmannia lanceolata TaxID=3420 RepID=UPI004063EC50